MAPCPIQYTKIYTQQTKLKQPAYCCGASKNKSKEIQNYSLHTIQVPPNRQKTCGRGKWKGEGKGNQVHALYTYWVYDIIARAQVNDYVRDNNIL